MKYTLLVLFAAVSIFGFEAAAPGTELPDSSQQSSIPYLELMEDKRGELCLAEIIQPEFRDRFAPADSHISNLGISRSTYWYRFRLEASPNTHKTRLLDIDRAWIPVLELWVPVEKAGKKFADADSRWRKVSAIAAHDSLETGLLSRHSYFPIPEKYDQARPFYLKIASWGPPLNFSMTIIEEDAFRNLMTIDFGIFGIIYGIILAMLLYNGFIYLSLRDRTYLIYVMYILSTFLYISASIGHSLAVVGIPPDKLFFLVYSASGLSIFFAAYFCRSFLFTRKNAPFIDKILVLHMTAALLLSATAVSGYYHLLQFLISIIGIVFPLTAIAAGLTCLLKGFRPAGYFLAAWWVLSVGILLWSLRGLGILPQTQVITYIFPTAVAAETILLSLAMADRIRMLQREKQQLEIRERRLLKLSNTDGLTKLFNKRYFDERIKTEISMAHNFDYPVTLLIMDLDDFKSINDRYGHPIGDRVLVHLGKIITRSIRESDCGCRFGGDEFVIILTGMDTENGWTIAERIRLNLADAVFKTESGESFTITVSIGVAEYHQDEEISELITRVDQALYRAKKLGKNKTYVWDSDEFTALAQ